MKKLLFLMSAMLVLTLTSFGQLINKGTIKLENGEEKIASVPYQTLGVITLTSKQVEMKAISIGIMLFLFCNKLYLVFILLFSIVSLIFLLVSSDLGFFILSVFDLGFRKSALWSSLIGPCNFPFLASDIFCLLSSENILFFATSLIFSLCSGVCLVPRRLAPAARTASNHFSL